MSIEIKRAGFVILQRVAIILALSMVVFVNNAFAKPNDELTCLSLNVYHEARNQPDEGKRAVAHVTLNRVQSKRFPNTVCGVVLQGAQRRGGKCQFSWWCDGKSDTPRDRDAWGVAQHVAYDVFMGADHDLTEGSLWYHTLDTKPVWRTRLVKFAAFGDHVFYNKQWKW